ncbi:MAG: C39 family peptidase [Chloroflexi bacterium]|nr:C39 family peptidase [Chloroflexota bacterium]
MSQRNRGLVLAITFIQLVAILGLLALPKIVQTIPGRYRVRLAEMPIAQDVLALVTTPYAEALPTPGGNVNRPAAALPTGVVALPDAPTPTSTPEATATTEPPPTPAPQNTVTATSTPSPTPSPTLTPSPTPLPESVRLEGITAVAQTFNNCGPANLTQVLNFYGTAANQNDVAAFLKPDNEDRNVSPWQIEAYVTSNTSLRVIYRSGGTLELLKLLIAAGYPVVIEKGYEPGTANAQGWFGHYLTLFGYDEANQVFHTQDSYLGPFDGTGRPESYANIEQFWQQFNYTFYVVYEPAQEEEMVALLGPELMDDRTMWEGAAARAQAEIEADPENAFAWFNLGTNLAELGNMTGEAEFYDAAAAAYDQARVVGLPPRMLWYQFRIYLAYIKTERYEDVITLADTILANEGGRYVEETYYYKGWALLYSDTPGAITNLELALERNPNFTPAQLMLDSLS